MSELLFDAIVSHDPARVSSALAAGADPNKPLASFPFWHPLEEAIEQLEAGGSNELISLLLAHGARVNDQSREGTSPLLMAVHRGKREAVSLLLNAGADPNARDSEGDSPLGVCVERGDLSMAKQLLQFGATKTINEPAGGYLGLNALGMAVRNLDLVAVALLLEFGADPKTRDADGRTAIEVLRLAPQDNQKLSELVAEKLRSAA